MKHIKRFKDTIVEKLKVVRQGHIDIEKFDNEISDRESWDLSKWSYGKKFTEKESIKLNLGFGVLEDISNQNYYDFNLKFDMYGREKINFNGVINKKCEYDDRGDETLECDIFYLINGFIKFELSDNKGERSINLKFEKFEEMISFFKTFKENIGEKIQVYGMDINENISEFSTILPDREMKHFSWILSPKFKTYKSQKYDSKMERLRKNTDKYNIIFDILDYMDLYNNKVGINRNISITNLDHIINKSIYNLKELKHKWEKLSNNPDIKVEDIFKDFS